MNGLSKRELGLRTSALLLSVLATASCSILDAGSGAADDELVSNRPQTDRYFSAIVKLSTPALLDTATADESGVMVIDASAATQIASEQAAFIEGLQRRSSDVRVLYKYRMILNGVSILAPVSMQEEIHALPGVSSVDQTTKIEPPRDVPEPLVARSFPENSVKWIGASKAKSSLGLNGRGVRVGVIDTGVDYTHKMFGGPGTAEAYTNNQPSVVEPSSFPTKRVVAGIDLVGTDYDSASSIEANRIPKPDGDPLDERGHGTHVAGTIGGVGDDTNTYDGVAPDVDLYAVKVFGSKGSTDQGPIIAALEYAADPNADGDLADRLDVVNLSLGSDWGTRLGLYTDVVKSLTRGGTLFVASAGNSGAERYIVGSPSTADDALSVAASTDNSAAATPADLLVGFSSWGPRSLDAIIKPEVAAPGSQILSAKMGGGQLGRRMSGTSMASPHITGVAALLRQAHPKASPAELKSLLMNTALGMKDRNGKPYAISKIGGGRVQAYEAALSPLVFDPPAISLGIVSGNTVTRGSRTLSVRNISDAAVHASVAWRTSDGLALNGPSSIDVPAGGSTTLDVAYTVDVTRASVVESEVEGQVIVDVPAHDAAPALTLAVPALAVATRSSEIALTATPFAIGPVSLALSNHGPIDGDVLAFNLLARDDVGKGRSGPCDLSAAGYRVVPHTDAGVTKDLLQFGFSLASPLSTWNFCELSVLVDENGDGIAEQEIAGTFDTDLRAPPAPGTSVDPFATFLVDAPAMRAVRARVEQGQAQATEYPSTVLDEQPFVRFPMSTVAYISADLSKLKRTASGKLRIKLGALPATEGAVADDFLGGGDGTWFEIDPAAIPYTAMSERITTAASTSSTLDFRSAGGSGGLVVYLPHNSAAAGRSLLVTPDGQSLLIR
jgi:subtilisin family serine protease